MRKTLLTLIIFFPLLGFSQAKISGHVYNAQNNEILPYANIIIEGKDVGTMSDKNGMFELIIKDEILTPSDRVTFYHLGFQAITQTVEELAATSGVEIYLEPTPYEIQEISVVNRKSKIKNLGRSSGGSHMLAIPFFKYDEIKRGDRIGKEVGTIIKIKSDSEVKSFNVLISRNLYDLAKFRLTFYSVEDDLPGDVLIDRDITFEIKSKLQGWYKLDLSSYDIFMSGEQEVLVTLTLLDEDGAEIPNIFYLNGALLGKGIYNRNVGMSKWERHGGTIAMYLESRVYSD